MANEVRLIDAEVLAEEISSLKMTITGLRFGKGVLSECIQEYHKSILKIVNDAPTVDAVPVVHGRWIEHTHISYDGGYNGANYECSACGFNDVYDTEDFNYCPNCGAKMDGDGNE